jgi:hypothetical protein
MERERSGEELWRFLMPGDARKKVVAITDHCIMEAAHHTGKIGNLVMR